MHTEEEALEHTLLTITEPGTYFIKGELKGQIAVDLGEEAKNDPEAKVTLIFGGATINCEIAPAVIFYSVYECETNEEPSRDVDVSNAGAKIIIADESINNINGANVAKIFEDTPENSIPAFEKAIEYGFAIETDIHITADGEVVVFHDDTLERMCGEKVRPEDLTLAQLREYKLANTEHKIPTLRELLELTDGKVPLLIEFKTKSPKTCRPLCRAANEILKDYKGKYFMQSFYPPAVMWYRRHRKDILRGQLSTAKFDDKGIHMDALSAMLLNVFSRPDFVSYEYKYPKHLSVLICKALGAHMAAWTYTSQEQIDATKDTFSTNIFEQFIPEK